MIERDHREGTLTVKCDECGEDLESDFSVDQFHQAIEHAKAEDWTVKPDGQGRWVHYCPDCGGGALTALQKAQRLFGQR